MPARKATRFWLLLRGKDVVGPHPIRTVLSWLGNILPENTPVCPEGDSAWTSAIEEKHIRASRKRAAEARRKSPDNLAESVKSSPEAETAPKTENSKRRKRATEAQIERIAFFDLGIDTKKLDSEDASEIIYDLEVLDPVRQIAYNALPARREHIEKLGKKGIDGRGMTRGEANEKLERIFDEAAEWKETRRAREEDCFFASAYLESLLNDEDSRRRHRAGGRKIKVKEMREIIERLNQEWPGWDFNIDWDRLEQWVEARFPELWQPLPTASRKARATRGGGGGCVWLFLIVSTGASIVLRLLHQW